MHNMHGIQLQKKLMYAVGVCVDTGFEVLDLRLDWDAECMMKDFLLAGHRLLTIRYLDRIPLLFRFGHHKLPIIDAWRRCLRITLQE
ncbi:hypothetical protein QFZ80_005113 [Paenibacillus sp. V4I7]|nr:hypothetical protein [Paenibacillus sp. V4I7]MDQ0920313.1 hypothetical protein [Paenibacillus sp. V4I5]